MPVCRLPAERDRAPDGCCARAEVDPKTRSGGQHRRLRTVEWADATIFPERSAAACAVKGNRSSKEAKVNLKWIAPVALIIAVAMAPARAQTHQHESVSTTQPMESASVGDARQLVQFPGPMRQHTIANMRDHLLALQEIDLALSRNEFDKAANLAETRLGMSSLEAHGASHIAPYMPQRMQDIGTQMHRAASRFAVEAQNASVGNDVRPALAALSAVMEQCVACHAAYRLH